MYNVHVPFPFLWSIDGSFERRRWPPRAQPTTAVDEDSYQFELAQLDDERPAVQMQWVVTIDANGELCLRTDWTCLRPGEFDA
jgi:hypothetical protein